MKNSIIKLTFVTAVVVASGIGALKAYNSNCQNENLLLVENVEALSDHVETVTTWNCDGSTKYECAIQCGRCGTAIKGRGNLTGVHSCSYEVSTQKHKVY